MNRPTPSGPVVAPASAREPIAQAPRAARASSGRHAALAIDTAAAARAVSSFIKATTVGPRVGDDSCVDSSTAPMIAAFWQMDPQEFKRLGNLNLLANNAVYESTYATPFSSCSQDSQDSHTPPRSAGTTMPFPPEFFSRKENFVESLVETATAMLELQFRATPAPTTKRLVPLKSFIQELLKRSRTSFSTLQLALLYLLRFKQTMTASSQQQSRTPQPVRPTVTSCARRMFLSALIVANKYLQDRNYSNNAWSRICGLTPAELTKNEAAFLSVMDWKLFVPKSVFMRWSTMLLTAAAQMTKRRAEKAAPAAAMSRMPNVTIANGVAQSASTARQAALAPLTPPVDFDGSVVAALPFSDRTAPVATSIAAKATALEPAAALWAGAERVEEMTMLSTPPVETYLPSPRIGTKRKLSVE